jgi:hypothetical protein
MMLHVDRVLWPVTLPKLWGLWVRLVMPRRKPLLVISPKNRRMHYVRKKPTVGL